MPDVVSCAEAQIDPDWDAFVAGTSGGDLTQTTVWAASRQRLGFRCLHVIVRTDAGTLVGGGIVYARRLGPGLWIGTVPRGPVVARELSGSAAAVAKHVVRAVRRFGIRALIVQAPEGAESTEAALKALGFRPGPPSIAPEATTRLDLRKSDDELLSAMATTRRNTVRRAIRANYDVRENADVALFHRLHAATAARQHFEPVSQDNLQAQWDLLAPRGMCVNFVLRHEGVPASGIWLTQFAGVWTYKLAGWDATVEAPRETNEALHWTAIQWARSQGAHAYDLGGLERKNAERIVAGLDVTEEFRSTTGYFKQRFGGDVVLLPRAQFRFTDSAANVLLGGLGQLFLGSDLAHTLANQLRDGRLRLFRRGT